MPDEVIVMDASAAPAAAPAPAPAQAGLEGVSEPVVAKEVEGEKPAADATSDAPAEGTVAAPPATSEIDLIFDETLPFDKETQGKFHTVFGDEAVVLLPQIAAAQAIVKEFGAMPDVETLQELSEAGKFLGELATNLETNPAEAVVDLMFNKRAGADGSQILELSTEGEKIALGFAQVLPQLPPGPAFNQMASHFVRLLHQGASREEQAAQQRVERARAQGYESEAKAHEVDKLTHEVFRQETEKILKRLAGDKGPAPEPPDIKAAREALEKDRQAFEQAKQEKIQAEINTRMTEANTILTGVYESTVTAELQKVKDKVPAAIFNAISRDLAATVDTEFKKGAGNLVLPRVKEFSQTGDRAKLEQAKGTYRAKVQSLVATHAPRLIREYAPGIQLVDKAAQEKVAAAAGKVDAPGGVGGVSGGTSEMKRAPGESWDAFVSRVRSRPT